MSYCVVTVLLHIHTAGLEAQRLSMFMKKQHCPVLYFAVQCSGCVYFHGSYSG